jgi:hypothetical protein
MMNFGLDSLHARTSMRRRYAWLWLCAVTLFLSLEEVATIHESIGDFLHGQLQGGGQWAEWVGKIGRRWVIVYAPAIITVAAFILFMFIRLWREFRGISLSALAGLTLWITSLGLEFFLTDLCRGAGNPLRCAQGEMLLEEACEIFGTSSLLIATVWYAQLRSTTLIRTIPMNTGAS